jgi:hypothetical protein
MIGYGLDDRVSILGIIFSTTSIPAWSPTNLAPNECRGCLLPEAEQQKLEDDPLPHHHPVQILRMGGVLYQLSL